MEQRHIQLAAGVDLLTVCTNQFKTGFFTVNLTVPLREETATAYALIPDVLYRGSRKHPDIVSLSAATDDLYGAALEVGVRQRGESQCVCLQCSFIDDQYALDGMAVLEPAIALVGEILLDPLLENGIFCESYVCSERANLADRIQARINDKTEWSVFRLLSEMCRGEAFALDKLGDAEKALSLTAEALWEHYQTLLAEAGIIFTYNGSAPYERVESAVRSVFASLITDRYAPHACVVLDRPAGAVREVRDVLDVTQGKLAMGFRTGGVTMGDPRFPALLVCNTLFGGSGTSKLFMNVRERMGLCYFASSMIDKLKGILMVISGVDAADFDIARQEILAQLAAIRNGEFTSSELNAAIRAVVSGLVSRRDSQSQIEDDLLTGVIGQGTVTDHDGLIHAVEQVTAPQVSEAAGAILLDTVYYLSGKEGM